MPGTLRTSHRYFPSGGVIQLRPFTLTDGRCGVHLLDPAHASIRHLSESSSSWTNDGSSSPRVVNQSWMLATSRRHSCGRAGLETDGQVTDGPLLGPPLCVSCNQAWTRSSPV